MSKLFPPGLRKFLGKLTGAGVKRFSPPRRGRDEDEGLGVPVPAGPQPWKGGAHAKLPPELELTGK
ncbi:hypothetical protein [Deinococcus hopiensis]|uniref:Uncharacterized protein n=1 Tax=Deinococcus hopiensis KR-140 TaxID=695939 RepID=A0A1W1VAH3_9DEIO|nr:hypothetical protein [Deinococcus hopiensis]SMB90286.1 hypothetical protein SAMN00790413_00710 [Deinococcus hopiensis KR-140]